MGINYFLLASFLLIASAFGNGPDETLFKQFIQIKEQMEKSGRGVTTFDPVSISSQTEYQLKSVSLPSRKPGEFCYVLNLSDEKIERRVILYFKIENNGAPIEKVRDFLKTGKAQNDLVLRRIDIYSYNASTKELTNLKSRATESVPPDRR